MKVYLVVSYGWDFERTIAVYTSKKDAERHAEFQRGPTDLQAEEVEVWPGFSEKRFTKKGFLRAAFHR